MASVAERRLALHLHVVLVVVHLEHRLRGVDDLPHHDGGDLDRVAVLSFTLSLALSKLRIAQRDRLLRVERVRPAQPGALRGADVAAEELQHPAFVRVHDEEAGEQEDHQDDAADDAEDAMSGARARCHRAARCSANRPDATGEDQEQDGDPGEPITKTLADHLSLQLIA